VKFAATNELTGAQRESLAAHALALDEQARRLRFGAQLSDEAIRAYVDSIDFDRDAVFVIFDAELRIAGAAHLVCSDDGAELGISVLAGHRGRGIGQALLARARLHARNRTIDVLFMHCLAENETMRHLARKQGMAVVVERGEATARVALEPGNLSTVAREFIANQVGLFDYALKAHVLSARRLADALSGATTMVVPGNTALAAEPVGLSGDAPTASAPKVSAAVGPGRSNGEPEAP
jgi:GNAT superfamily N-acetyltransferase